MIARRSGISELEAVRELLRSYGVGCPHLETEEDVRGWLAKLGQRFAVHFREMTGRKIRCQGWGLPQRRGAWLHPLTFSVGGAPHAFYLSLAEMHSLHQAHPDHQLVVSERLYHWLEEVMGSPEAPRRGRSPGNGAAGSSESPTMAPDQSST